MLPGIDILGFADSDWPIKTVVRAIPSNFALGVFDGPETFGSVVPKLRKLLRMKQYAAIRIHAAWTNHSLISMDVLRKRCPAYEALAKEWPGVRFYVSHTCEYESRDKLGIDARVRLVAKLCPSCTVVQNPMPGYYTVPNVGIIEKHGDKALARPGEIVSTDGQALFDMNAQEWLRKNSKATIAFAWGFRCNLSESGTKILPPYTRTAAPDEKYLQGLVHLFDDPGVPPTPTFQGKVIPLKAPLLWKTFAEDMPRLNSRDNKPVAFLPRKADNVEICTFNGIRLGKLVYFPDDAANGPYRYYAGYRDGIAKYGWEIAELAKAKSGSPHIWLKLGNDYFGPIHPSFRQGFFHL